MPDPKPGGTPCRARDLWTPQHDRLAALEGWQVSTRDDGRLAIEKTDDPANSAETLGVKSVPRLPSDAEALRHCIEKARRGSKLHLLALILDWRNSDDEVAVHATLRENPVAHVDQPTPKLRITKFIRTGETDGTAKTLRQLLHTAGRLLDKSCAHDILGQVVFKGGDGQFYVMTVEAVVGRASPEYLTELALENADETDQS